MSSSGSYQQQQAGDHALHHARFHPFKAAKLLKETKLKKWAMFCASALFLGGVGGRPLVLTCFHLSFAALTPQDNQSMKPCVLTAFSPPRLSLPPLPQHTRQPAHPLPQLLWGCVGEGDPHPRTLEGWVLRQRRGDATRHHHHSSRLQVWQHRQGVFLSQQLHPLQGRRTPQGQVREGVLPAERLEKLLSPCARRMR